MTDNKDTWYCYDCQSLVPDGEHLPAHHRCQGIGEDFVAAICAEQREKDAQKIAKHLGGMVATHMWLTLDSLLMDIREGKEE